MISDNERWESIDQITIIKIHQNPNLVGYTEIKIIIINKRKEQISRRKKNSTYDVWRCRILNDLILTNSHPTRISACSHMLYRVMLILSDIDTNKYACLLLPNIVGKHKERNRPPNICLLPLCYARFNWKQICFWTKTLRTVLYKWISKLKVYFESLLPLHIYLKHSLKNSIWLKWFVSSFFFLLFFFFFFRWI